MANSFVFQQIANNTTRGWSWRRRVEFVIWLGPDLFLAATLLFAAQSAIYVARPVPVQGTVVAHYEWPGETFFDRGTTNYEPIFTCDLEGESVRASVGSAHSSFDVPIGTTATIRAIQGENGNVRPAIWQGLWFIPAMLSIFTLVAFAIALPLWLVARYLFNRRTS